MRKVMFKKFVEYRYPDPSGLGTLTFDWHKQSIIQILEAEIERLKGMKKETKGVTSQSCRFCFVQKGGEIVAYNQSLDDQITHLTNIIKEIK